MKIRVMECIIATLIIACSGCSSFGNAAVKDELHNYPGGHMIQTIGSNIYFSDGQGVKMFDEKTDEINDVVSLDEKEFDFSKDNLINIYLLDKRIIYLSRNNNNTAYAYSLNSGDTTMLPFRARNLFVSNGNLYYMNYENNGGMLFKYDFGKEESIETITLTPISAHICPNSRGIVFVPYKEKLIRWVDNDGKTIMDFDTKSVPALLAVNNSVICYTESDVLHIRDIKTSIEDEADLGNIIMLWAVYDDVVYYSLEDKDGVWAYDLKSHGVSQTYEKNVSSFQICDGWMFIYQSDESSPKIIQMDT
ncbi:MAG: hypothetical protein ACOX1Q_00605 [Eubacteriales bacterium]|jgi:hypothetical protein